MNVVSGKTSKPSTLVSHFHVCIFSTNFPYSVKAWSQTKQFVEKLDEVKKDSSLLENIIRNTPYLRVQYDILIQRSEPERDMLYKNQVEHLYDLAFVSFIL